MKHRSRVIRTALLAGAWLAACLSAFAGARPARAGTLGPAELQAAFDGRGRGGLRLADVAGVAAAPAVPAVPAAAEVLAAAPPAAAFTDQTAVLPLVVAALDSARSSLRLMLFDLSQPEALAALRRAAGRPGVSVQVILDEGHAYPAKAAKAPSPEIEALLAGRDIELRLISGLGGTMHSKTVIVDDRTVMFGSYNLTRTAEHKSHENVVFSRDPARVTAHRAYWDWVWAHARPASGGRRGSPKLSEGPPRGAAGPVRLNGRAFPVSCFSPKGGTLEWIIEAIRSSRTSIDVAMFSLTQQGIAEALLERKRAGVKVRLLLDSNQARASEAVGFLRRNGFAIRLLAGRAADFGVMHHKFAVFDGAMVETGAYNWTANAEVNNFENADFLDEPAVVEAFAGAFERLWAGAAPAAD